MGYEEIKYKGGFIKPIGNVDNRDNSSMYDDILISSDICVNDSMYSRMKEVYEQRLKLKASRK